MKAIMNYLKTSTWISPCELRKEITQSTHLVNSTQKLRFPSTDVYLHPENQSLTSIQSSNIGDERTL